MHNVMQQSLYGIIFYAAGIMMYYFVNSIAYAQPSWGAQEHIILYTYMCSVVVDADFQALYLFKYIRLFIQILLRSSQSSAKTCIVKYYACQNRNC